MRAVRTCRSPISHAHLLTSHERDCGGETGPEGFLRLTTAARMDPRLLLYRARWKCPSFVTSLWHQRLLAWGPGLLVNWKDLNCKAEKCANK